MLLTILYNETEQRFRVDSFKDLLVASYTELMSDKPYYELEVFLRWVLGVLMNSDGLLIFSEIFDVLH